ncbi:MAG: precorrin-6A/cobalt-precorrin-6A reductase [Coleofasciculus chthonoplastes F3-SA18-01]|jgi:precorrin-6A/cobalt-precorrin-6A reductase|uniref:precorrin-6A/cobalt-precorrin-6A reductase n=1 Tax=Coleofasciculus chthonoplastes TaxID=64178 RepID=UPI0032FC8752
MPASQRRLWLIGGTSESVQLAEAIASVDLPYLVTVTTAAAKSLYPQTPNLQIQVGRLNGKQIEQLCQQQPITAILDASHPYAVEISRIAIATAQRFQIPYLRFERPRVEGDGGDEGGFSNIRVTTTENSETRPYKSVRAGFEQTLSSTAKPNSLNPPLQRNNQPGVITLDSFETLVAGDYLNQQRVLLTVGYKVLSLFQDWQARSTLFARILPGVTSLEAVIAAGFSRDRIIALRPPVPFELEMALWRHWDISLVVTKASGVAGGETTKRQVAAQLGIPLLVIDRPVVTYPQQTSDVAVALEFCQRYL